MLARRLLPALLAAALAAGGAPAIAAQAVAPAPTAMQAQVLRALGMPIVLPAVVPPGFKLTQVVAYARAERGPGMGPSYAAIYEDGKKAFGVESTPGGVGDLPSEPKAWFAPRGISKERAPLHFQDGSWLSGWIEHRGQLFRFVGAKFANDTITPLASEGELDQAWALRVAASLRPVKP